MHWLLDVNLNEDLTKLREESVQKNLNILKKIALNSNVSKTRPTLVPSIVSISTMGSSGGFNIFLKVFISTILSGSNIFRF